jgi:hypothetical protein
LDIHKNSDNSFQFGIAPNPVESVLIFQAKSNAVRKVSIQIYDALSQKVIDIEPTNISNYGPLSIDVSNLSKGIYFAKASTGNDAFWVQRFIKN